jgi:hypothetical protein
MSTLPSPRHFLTSLIDSIANIQPAPVDDARPGPPNPLRHLPPSVRPLLTTLHVLFPALLLPSLDLLDRSLVTAVLPEQQEEPSLKPSFFLVRSVASTSRKTYNAFTAATPYVVRLDAWNCSCANFAFEAFPSAGRGATIGPATEVYEPCDEDAGDLETEFGGLSFDGREAGGVPCCKHLLACLLAERWGSVLGSYIVTRRASKEEMVGLLADT